MVHTFASTAALLGAEALSFVTLLRQAGAHGITPAAAGQLRQVSCALFDHSRSAYVPSLSVQQAASLHVSQTLSVFCSSGL